MYSLSEPEEEIIAQIPCDDEENVTGLNMYCVLKLHDCILIGSRNSKYSCLYYSIIFSQGSTADNKGQMGEHMQRDEFR
jgi:hypothetical protein